MYARVWENRYCITCIICITRISRTPHTYTGITPTPVQGHADIRVG